MKQGTIESLKLAIKNYFKVVDDMQDEVLVMYQEAKSLSKDALPYVLKKEAEMAAMFKKIIDSCIKNGELTLTEQESELISHNIIVQGQMWAFRRWTIQKTYTIDQYIELQTKVILQGVGEK
jgi:hypothetical protein